MRSPIKDANDILCIDAIESILPKECPVKTFLFFSGNLELDLASRDHQVTAYTNKYVIFEFWKCVSSNPHNIIQKAEWLHEKLNVDLVYTLQENWPTHKDPYVRSALFVLLNAYSNRGTISSGHFSLDNYNPIITNKLRNLYGVDKKINIAFHYDENYLDCFNKLGISDEILIFPVGKFSHNWLEHGKSIGFEEYSVNHKMLKQKLEESECKFILWYKKHPALFKMYHSYTMKLLNKYGSETSKLENCHDILIYNF
jgi:hypothetical protein